jgi:hypothetical protein
LLTHERGRRVKQETVTLECPPSGVEQSKQCGGGWAFVQLGGVDRRHGFFGDPVDHGRTL